ncbi:uncharacterized protein B0I36DRAFT_331210 [Microdochium trichocladiopsis]|uniref:Uncharacterized protein n=1 Tax=Microdochium trichocladiopsis TaxID=1682393 RepID=A0A9P8Y3Z4_9PEZI|nr:uncharacterized protein B0I36DRAFT_331210 [Microdochium trichocladiopsis]KAH7026738.1 hypothetical protein B0I36DRAFT_331210 [Microdochium trichocladiopsis]
MPCLSASLAASKARVSSLVVAQGKDACIADPPPQKTRNGGKAGGSGRCTVCGQDRPEGKSWRRTRRDSAYQQSTPGEAQPKERRGRHQHTWGKTGSNRAALGRHADERTQSR